MWMKLKPLSQNFFQIPSYELAPKLLGHFLVHRDAGKLMAGKIVEVEAYHEMEAACHAYRGQTPSNASLFKEGGHAYIYFIYGLYWMLNISTGPKGSGQGILIRAIEPVEGREWMLANRPVEGKSLTNGPAKLAKALNITNLLQGDPVFKEGGLWVAEGAPVEEKEIVATTRIGVDFAGIDAKRPWRFYIKDNPFVSRK
jgi:DNA-3-methyladenine glycosylase